MADAEVASEVSSAFSNMDMDEANLWLSDSVSQVSAAASSSPRTSDSSSSKRKRRITRSDISLYCREGREEDREAIHHGSGLYYYCKLCSKRYTSSESAWVHLQSTYKIQKPEEKKLAVASAADSPLKRSFAATPSKMSAQKERVAQQRMGDVINRERFNEALVRLITVRNLLISAVEWPELEDLLKATNPAVR